MLTYKLPKLLTINAMAMAVIAATAFSAQAAVIMDYPAQIRPEAALATLDNTAETWIGGFTQNASLHFNGGIPESSISTDHLITSDAFDELVRTDSVSILTLMQIDSALSVDLNQVSPGQTNVGADKLTSETVFPGSIWIRSGAIYAPGGPPRSANKGAQPAHIAGNYTQDNGAALLMDISKNRSDLLVVGGNISLDGVLALALDGMLDTGYRVLIKNRGSAPIRGAFSGICFDNMWITLNPLEGTHGGGTFTVNGVTYALSYAGDAATGSLDGGSDLILIVLDLGAKPSMGSGSQSSAGFVGISYGGGGGSGGSGGGGGGGGGGSPHDPGGWWPPGGGEKPPVVPEPTSLAILGLGTAALITRRRK
ncbi:MAG: PEP-CTERM sorting domain-containing protein [Phycisphaerales bacterium]|nr:PEP-CTERM sorting domain-containing protein [Phycisphaerales bacterium]